MDPATLGLLGTAIGAANGANTLLGSAVSAVKKLRETKQGDKELLAALVDVSEQLVEARLVGVGLKEQLAKLQEALTEAQSRESRLEQREFKNGYYYLKEPLPSGYAAGPYCTGCWDSKGSLILLRKANEVEASFCVRVCPVCKATYRPSIDPPAGGSGPSMS